jgi:hypothetical protein
MIEKNSTKIFAKLLLQAINKTTSLPISHSNRPQLVTIAHHITKRMRGMQLTNSTITSKPIEGSEEGQELVNSVFIQLTGVVDAIMDVLGRTLE